MNRNNVTSSHREEVNKLRRKLNQLEVNSVEQRASNEVHKWRQTFNTSSSSQLEQVVNEMEKSKVSEVSRLANELRTSLDQFKGKTVNRLAELDAFISKLNINDSTQLNYVKFELGSITKEIESLHIDITVQVPDSSKQRRSSSVLARNSLEVVKVFDFKKPQPVSSSSSNFLEPLKTFVRRASLTGANQYNVNIAERKTHF